jgi:hypothetical protein
MIILFGKGSWNCLSNGNTVPQGIGFLEMIRSYQLIGIGLVDCASLRVKPSEKDSHQGGPLARSGDNVHNQRIERIC